jgi:small subunit ribosomal protein S20
MPITKSAQKALRNSLKKRVFNLRRKDAMTDAVKRVKKLTAAGKGAEAEKALSAAYQAIDKAAKTGFIKKNVASRKKSRLVALFRRGKTTK